MLRNRSLRFLLAVAIAIVLIIILIIIIFSGGSSSHLPVAKPMAAYADNSTAQVAMLIDGPFTTPAHHNQVLIVVNNSQATIDTFQGFNDTLLKSNTYPFSQAGFHVFLRSLEFAKFNDGSNNPALSQASGYCPLGDRYIFSFNVNNRQVQRYWTTSCSGVTHTFNGNLSLTMQLFKSLFPDYSNLTSDLNI